MQHGDDSELRLMDRAVMISVGHLDTEETLKEYVLCTMYVGFT